MSKFHHKTLGTFTRHEEPYEVRWENELVLPAFAAFSYTRTGKRRRSKKVPVEIRCDYKPTPSSIKVLQAIKKSQKQSVKNICTTFFHDLRQQGYEEPGHHGGYGMWWSQDPIDVALSCREALLKRVKRERMWEPDDLLVVLYEPRIEIYSLDSEDDDLPHTRINFGAEFEDEHGVSVRTDGKQVLNVGYAGEA